MKDRTPTQVLANGAIRYGIYGDDGTLLRYEYIKPEDDPTQVGTPLNKATLLSDKTAEGLGLSGDPSVNDAINVARGNVGDIMLTTKSTLGEDWVLCNGAMVDETTYPVLAKMLPAKDMTDLWDTATTAPSHYSLGTDGTIFAKVDHATCTIYYTDDPLGIWQSYVATEIAAVGTFTNDTEVHIEYMNGQWVIWGVMSAGTRIFYADKITGPYVQSTLAISTNYTMYDLMYGGGYYLVSYSNASTPLRYATTLVGDWTSSSDLPRYSNGGIYVNGMYVYYHGTNLYYSNSPAGTYTTVSLSDVLSNSITSLQYVNGLFVVGSKASLVYASGLTGSWTTVSFTTISATYLVYDVTYINEHWVVCLGSSHTGGNTGRVLVSETSDISSSYTEVSSIGGDQLACTSKICLTNTNACRGIGPQLPSVSIDGCYAFIRAKV